MVISDLRFDWFIIEIDDKVSSNWMGFQEPIEPELTRTQCWGFKLFVKVLLVTMDVTAEIFLGGQISSNLPGVCPQNAHF